MSEFEIGQDLGSGERESTPRLRTSKQHKHIEGVFRSFRFNVVLGKKGILKSHERHTVAR